MRYRSYLPLSLSILIFAAGCSKKPATGPHTLSLDLQSWYRHDSVQIVLDGQTVFNDTATTNAALGVATSRRISGNLPHHTVKVVVNRQDSTSEAFDQSGDLYLGITFWPTPHQITINYSDTPYLYL